MILFILRKYESLDKNRYTKSKKFLCWDREFTLNVYQNNYFKTYSVVLLKM